MAMGSSDAVREKPVLREAPDDVALVGRVPAEPWRSLDASVRDVAYYGVMLGLGEAFLGAYAIYLQASELWLAALGALPPFVGALTQLACANLLDRYPRRRPLYLLGGTLQGCSWLAIACTLLLPREAALPVLMVAVIVYFSSVHFSVPAWNSTMGDLIPLGIRGRYLAWRDRSCIVCQWVGTIVAGIGLEVFASSGGVEYGYALIFLGALLARMASVFYLGMMKEPPYRPRPEDRFTLVDFLKAYRRSNFAHFVLYVAAISLSAFVAAPYFVLFMLRELRLSYLEFTVASALFIAGQILQLYRWGSLCDRFGNKKVLTVCGFGVAWLPFFWLFVQGPWAVYVLHFLAGALWSGFNLSVANFIFDAVSPAKRARCVAYFNLVNGTGILLGGAVGGLLIHVVPRNFLGIALGTPILAVFFASFAFRVLTQIFLLGTFREVRDVAPISTLGLAYEASPLASIPELYSYLRGGWRGPESRGG